MDVAFKVCIQICSYSEPKICMGWIDEDSEILMQKSV